MIVVDSANNARSRLMRLTEAAGNLRRQAAVEVRVGKEDEARELLLQKKKVIQALEKSKKRVELLDKLSGKLNEVILCIFLKLMKKIGMFGFKVVIICLKRLKVHANLLFLFYLDLKLAQDWWHFFGVL